MTRLIAIVAWVIALGCLSVYAQRSSGPAKGFLVVDGGGGTSKDRFVSLAGGSNARIVVIASGASAYKFGEQNTILATDDREVVNRWVDVGGYRLYLKCIGTGNPTVILEAGLGGDSEDWVKVMPDAGRLTRVCAYDRAREGKSDPAPRSLRKFGPQTFIELRNGHQIVHDLNTLLARAGVNGPYVLVGHSLGGVLAMLYASRYPKDVVGMVLVDSSHPDQFIRQAALTNPQAAKQNHDGLMQNKEGVDIDAILTQARATRWRGNIPLYVLARGVFGPPPDDWTAEAWGKYRGGQCEMQGDYARRSAYGKLIIAEKSGHDIPHEQPDLIVEAIRQGVILVRDKAIEN
jgi:pimeloyl-ACP methyl ester carboxylesterase